MWHAAPGLRSLELVDMIRPQQGPKRIQRGPRRNQRGSDPLQLQDLLDARQLGVRPLYLPDGALQQDVTWVFTTDLPDPSRYLTRGQLVLTGLVWMFSSANSPLTLYVCASTKQRGDTTSWERGSP